MLALATGCAHVPQQTGLEQQFAGQASTDELRTQVIELARVALREIESAADSIDAANADPMVRRNTLLWRLSSVPAAEEAALREDPVIALVDLNAFRIQTSDFLASPVGSSSFASGIPFAQRAMERLQVALDTVAVQVRTKPMSPEAHDRLAAWARAHPIEELPFNRSSVIGELAVWMKTEEGGLGTAVGGIQSSMDRIEGRVGLANEYAVSQGTWLVQLAALDIGRSPGAEQIMSTLSSTRGLVEQTPGLLDRERVEALADVSRQRLETLDSLAVERDLVLAALDDQRKLLQAAIDQQRRLIMNGADSIRARATVDGFRMMDRLAIGLGEVFAVLMAVGGLGLLLIQRRRA